MAPSLSRRDMEALSDYATEDEVETLEAALQAQASTEETPVETSIVVRRRNRWIYAPAWLVSSVLHTILLVVLGLVYTGLEGAGVDETVYIDSVEQETSEDLESLVLPDEIEPVDSLSLSVGAMLELDAGMPSEAEEIRVEQSMVSADPIELSDFAAANQNSDLLATVAAPVGKELEGRGAGMRGAMLKEYGGSPGSEKAVALALKWFAKHQRQDGSWSFDFGHTCKHKCSQSGHMDTCFTGATAMALLPFLGAGHTHKEGKYKDNVDRGIRYLVRVQGRNGSLVSGGGNMYAHGLSAIVLCEAYAMTRDQALKFPAQKALNFTMFAQDPVGGGWRYMPKQPGDTSAVAWQVMALKSGHIGHLTVSPRTVFGIEKFLRSVQSDGGATYGYMGRDPRPGTTAAGLLCRMYLGWDKDNPALVDGVEKLAEIGPAPDDNTAKYHMYYNYYATQVLRHYGGEHWKRWNTKMRDHLVGRQQTSGHMAGSWTVPTWTRAAHDVESGGRLYYTSLATMILEVYYRHMPIYSEAAADEFPL